MPTNEENNKNYNKQASRMGKFSSEKNIPGTNTPNPGYKRPGNTGGGGGGGDCFPAGTMIKTPAGEMGIEQVEKGDIVYSYDSNEMALVCKRVLARTNAHDSANIIKISFADESYIYTTKNHPFLTCKKWKKAKDLNTGDKLCAASTGLKTGVKNIVSITPIKQLLPVYNLIVEGNFNFIADGVVVHSFSYLKSARQTYWRFRYYLSSLIKHPDAGLGYGLQTTS